ncbi:hypothetical protein F2Q69_00023905 [Brassica cretica]|uniref:Uncharacterized protein n=1 Tax=Brassica cretica TaxID=69181 RepID=A0A8S9QFN1_BRACR|nr:hypothetical protein F2Q69_00023905 [Brassica cretica]
MIIDKSLFTVSHTGSVNVCGRDPNPFPPIVLEPSSCRSYLSAEATEGLERASLSGGGGGRRRKLREVGLEEGRGEKTTV